MNKMSYVGAKQFIQN